MWATNPVIGLPEPPGWPIFISRFIIGGALGKRIMPDIVRRLYLSDLTATHPDTTGQTGEYADR